MEIQVHDPLAYLPCNFGTCRMLLFWWSTEVLALTMTRLCVEYPGNDMSNAPVVHGTRISMAIIKQRTGQKHSACVHCSLSACL